MATMNRTRFQRGESVRLREIPGLVGYVINDLSACTPPMLHIGWYGSFTGSSVLDAAQVERVTFDCATQDWKVRP